MTAMMSWDLFEDLPAAQDEVLRPNGRCDWRPGQQRNPKPKETRAKRIGVRHGALTPSEAARNGS